MTIGMLFALSGEDEDRLLKCAAEDRPELVGEDFEERYTDEWFCDTDKAWDAIHRAFNDSILTYEFEKPLQGVILGGEPLYGENDYIISYRTAEEVKRVSEAISDVTEQSFRGRYFAIREDEYGEAPSEEDFGYCWNNLTDIRSFYDRAAKAERAVIFTAPQ